MIEVKERVTHNSVTYEAGSRIEKINKEQAQRLVDLGAAFFIEEIKEKESDHEFLLRLDEAFNATELKDVAKYVGLDFPGNISKANLLQTIVNEKKAEEILTLVGEE